ncbi:MAG: hypothetical protein U9R50_11075, partial [Campylobacterota bacterium]|nr:hypothetical protein [Campylobacterota bacterium]
MIQNSFIRWSISFLLGITITLALFYSMQMMIASNDNILDDKSVYKMIDFVQMHQKALEPELKKELPPEPKKPETPPKMANQVESQSDTAPN